MALSRAQLFELAEQAGHAHPAVWESGRGLYFATCSCGWESASVVVMVEALKKGVHHVLSEASGIEKAARRSGRPVGWALARYNATEHVWNGSGATGVRMVMGDHVAAGRVPMGHRARQAARHADGGMFETRQSAAG